MTAPTSRTPGSGSRSAGRPNVLVLLTDQQRWDTTGLHGNPLGLTPNLDRLAADGVSIDRSRLLRTRILGGLISEYRYVA